MKMKVLCVIMACATLLSACSAANPPAATTAPAAQSTPAANSEPAQTTFGITPFEKPTKLRIALHTVNPVSLPFYVAEQEGFWDELNIDVEFVPVTQGPAMMEANADWDIGGTGAAGVLAGQVGYDIPMIGIGTYESIRVIAKKDSAIAKDPQNPESWRGTTWVYPFGTTADLCMSLLLDSMGLTLSDIKAINMDFGTARSAFISNQADGTCAAFANAYISAAEGNGVQVAQSSDYGSVTPTGISATPKAISEKRDLIVKAWAVYYHTVDWCNETPENLQKASDYFLQACTEEGIQMTQELANVSIGSDEGEFNGPGFDGSVKLMQDAKPDPMGIFKDRDMLQAEIELMVAMDFFVGQGKYTAEDREDMLKSNLIDPSIALEAMELYGNPS